MMNKENVVILVIVTFIVGFVAGAVSGIRFYAKERRGSTVAGPGEVAPQGGDPHAVSTDEVKQAEEIVRKEPQNLNALITLGNLYFDSNQYRKAIDAYERALAIDPKNPDVRTDMGIMYRSTKEYDRAIKEFKEATSYDPTHKNARFNLAVVLQYDKKDVNGAILAWEEFLKVEPSGERADAVRRELAQLKQIAR
jgi:cytochrome c-type biogenesis protein CcmH/NrfG